MELACWQKKVYSELMAINLDNIAFCVTSVEHYTKPRCHGVPIFILSELPHNSIVLISEESKYFQEMLKNCIELDINVLVLKENYTYSYEKDIKRQFALLEIAELRKCLGKNRVNYESYLYELFSHKINELRAISNELKPANREECFDRPFINDYVKRNSEFIVGDVLEFAGGEIQYARKYGKPDNLYMMAGICHKDVYSDGIDFYADLDNYTTLPGKKFDCIVATQVIMYMNDPREALLNLKRMLKPGGHLILTVPGPLFHHSKNTHHMFSFTEDSIKYLCKNVFGEYKDFKWYGDLESTFCMLFWMKQICKNNVISYQPEYLYTLVMGITTENK